MENSFIPQAIDLVGKAVEADKAEDFEKALSLYRDALGRFTLGLKYEKNEARKKLIIERVEGYMKRAEELRDYLQKQAELEKNGGSGGSSAATRAKGDGGNDDEDAEKKKLKNSLASAIVTEKPNVKWEDVAGLDAAKESLKEVCRSECCVASRCRSRSRRHDIESRLIVFSSRWSRFLNDMLKSVVPSLCPCSSCYI